MKKHFCLLASLVTAAWLTGCGAPGAPLPPSLELPRPVEDLSASRKGNKVVLSWSAPTQTTDGQNIRAKRVGAAQICRGIDVFPMTSCAQDVGQIPPAQITLAKPGQRSQRLTFTDTLSEQVEREHPTGFATFAVAMLNSRGRNSGLSNQIQVPLAPVVTPPPDIKASVAADGIHLKFPCTVWTNNTSPLVHHYRIYRRVEGAPRAVMMKEFSAETKSTNAPSATATIECTPADNTIDWEKTYTYHVTPTTVVTEHGKNIAEVEGDDSPEIIVFAHDVFPPAQPTGLQAVYSGPGQKPFIDLTWAPNTDADLAGYEVYRHEEGQPAVKISPALVKTPSYRDDNVQPGHTYFYSVTAVDVRGNESEKSEETSEKVP